jgi:O-antigen ligase
MGTTARRLRPHDVGDLRVAIVASLATALVAGVAVHKVGLVGLLAPLAVVGALVLLRRPVTAVVLVIGLTAICEGPSFGFLHFTSNLYVEIYKGMTLVDLLMVLAIVVVALDAIRHRRPMQIPRPLQPGVVLLLLGLIAGAVTGHAAGLGLGLRQLVLLEIVPVSLLLLLIALANLKVSRRQLTLMLGGAMALAIFKAGFGLIEVAGHYGDPIEGTTTLTYYEPAANWLIMIALLTVFAAVVSRVKPPLWMLVGSPLLVASIVLSYRRSFWIATVLGLLLVLLFGTSPTGRRLLVPASLVIALAVVVLGSLHFQAQLPVVKRVESLAPTNLTANVQDRYRLDERANVWGAIREHPITGLGLGVPWQASVRALSVEHEEGRQYVHFAALWFWLKLGILGLAAYIAIMAGSLLLAWRVWRRSVEPLLRAFGLASLCGIAGLAVIETTASFTGIDARFTVLFSAQVGLLALLDRTAGPGQPEELPSVSGA